MTKLDVFLMREAVKDVFSRYKDDAPVTYEKLLSILDSIEKSDALIDDCDWYGELVKPLEKEIISLKQKIKYQNKIITSLAKSIMRGSNA